MFNDRAFLTATQEKLQQTHEAYSMAPPYFFSLSNKRIYSPSWQWPQTPLQWIKNVHQVQAFLSRWNKGKNLEQEQQIAIFNASKVLRQTRVKPADLVGSNRERPLGGPGPSISNVCRFRLRFVFAVAIRKKHVSSKKIRVPGRLSSRKSTA